MYSPAMHGLATLAIFVLMSGQAIAEKRPFYIVAHMVNEIRQVRHYLDRGANALESDIHFYPNGSVKELYHGFPCDCFRSCHRTAKLPDYLRHVREITDPDRENTYYDRMLLQFFDLKLSTSNNKTRSGRDLARHVLDYLWDGKRKQEVRVLVYLDSVDDSEVISGFLEEFKGHEDRLTDVGFDGGMGNLFEIRNMFTRLGIKDRIWQGDGRTNCISALYSDSRLRAATYIRDSSNSYMSKVYHWTIDLKLRMRLSLNLGVDAMLTNDPEDLVSVLEEPYYQRDFRIASVEDDPFTRFKGDS